MGTYRYRTLMGTVANIPTVVPQELFHKGVTSKQFKALPLSDTELPEELQQLRSDTTAIPGTYSNEVLPARTPPKLPDSAAMGHRAASRFRSPPTSL